MRLNGKVIFIISYENWGKMLMSKHHYAIELARAGNKVYFINHPDRRKKIPKGHISVSPTSYDNLFEVEHRLYHPYFLKFRVKWIFNFLTRLHIGRIIKKIETYPDVVWSFDTGNTIPLKIFSKSKLRILMPVDGPFGHIDELKSADEADVVISVTQPILDVFKNYSVPKLLINHGVADVFLNGMQPNVNGKQIKVGYSGSLIRNDLDTRCFLTVIKTHREVIFEFWGEYDHKKSNIHLPEDVLEDTLGFLDTLQKLPNVILHGPVDPAKLAEGLKRMDVLLICYRIKNDQNHHKVLEYLGTGKAIVSNYMSSYKDEDADLIYMVTSNDEIPELFNKVLSDLDHYNSPELNEKRKKFAQQYSYSNNIKRIEEFISAR